MTSSRIKAIYHLDTAIDPERAAERDAADVEA